MSLFRKAKCYDLTGTASIHLRAIRAELGLVPAEAPADAGGYLLPEWGNEELERSAS